MILPVCAPANIDQMSYLYTEQSIRKSTIWRYRRTATQNDPVGDNGFKQSKREKNTHNEMFVLIRFQYDRAYGQRMSRESWPPFMHAHIYFYCVLWFIDYVSSSPFCTLSVFSF